MVVLFGRCRFWHGGCCRCRCHLAPPPQDATPFTLGCTAPDAVLDAMLERVLETFAAHGASDAHPLRLLDTKTVGRKELGGACAPAKCVQHPRVLLRNFVHGHLPRNRGY